MKTFSLTKQNQYFEVAKKENFSGKWTMDETVSWSNKGRSKIHIILFWLYQREPRIRRWEAQWLEKRRSQARVRSSLQLRKEVHWSTGSPSPWSSSALFPRRKGRCGSCPLWLSSRSSWCSCQKWCTASGRRTIFCQCTNFSFCHGILKCERVRDLETESSE